MVEELEGYNSHGAASAKTSRQSKSTDKRKVSRIKNMEQFDNVKQVGLFVGSCSPLLYAI